ncbi:MAG: hypothetical protein KQI35_08100 [Bacteroidetes bacterium]|nr:hypothetical protein [Bacteroidota bacterium]
MRKQALSFLKWNFILLLVFNLISTSCFKDDEIDLPADNSNFVVSIERNDLQGWIIIGSSDGQETLEYKSFSGPSTLEFDTKPENITLTMVIQFDDLFGDDTITYYTINTYQSVNLQNWFFKPLETGGFEPTEINVTMTYPEDIYTRYLVSTHNGTYDYHNAPPPGNVEVDMLISRLQKNGKASLYGAVFTENGGFGSLLPDQEFASDQVNTYSLDLQQPLTSKLLMSAVPFKSIYIDGIWANRSNQIRLWDESFSNSKWGHNQSEYLIKYLENNTFEEFGLSCYYNDEMISYTFDKYYDASEGIPDNIADFNLSVTANPAMDGLISDINVSGEADFIHASGGYMENFPKIREYSWSNFVDGNASEIALVELPLEIKQEIGIDYEKIEPYYVAVAEYGGIDNLSDYLAVMRSESKSLFDGFDYRKSYKRYFYDYNTSQKNTVLTRDELKTIW